MSGRTVLDHALTLAAAGIPVFPCGQNKAPLTPHGFKDATTDLAKVETWWRENPDALPAVPTGAASGFDVIDVDPRHGGDVWLKANAASLAGTQVHATRSGGVHLLYRHADGLRCSASTIAPGVDLRADGGLVIWWPALGLQSKGSAVQWPVDLLNKARQGKAAAAGKVVAGCPPPSASAVVDLLDRLPNQIATTRDDYVAVAMAARGAIEALDEAGALDDDGAEQIGAAWVRWAERWEGYAGTDEQARWDSDFATRDSITGWRHLERIAERLLPGYREEQAIAEFTAEPLPKNKPFFDTASKLHWHGTKPYGNRRWLAYGVLPETGVALLSGQWGVGKTFAAMDLAAAVMTGTAFAGREVDRKCGVLWLAAEGETEVSDRLDVAMKRRPEQSGPLPFAWADDVPVLTAAGAGDKLAALVKIMNEGLAENGMRVGLIVVDTVAAAAGWRDEQDSAEAQVVMNVLRRVSRETGALVVAVDHYGKSVEAGTRGSSAKEAAADAVLALLGEKRENGTVENRRMAVRKLRGGATGGETAFELRVAEIGTDEHGRPVTTCAVDWTAEGTRQKAEPVPRTAAAALAVLTDLLSASGVSRVPEAEWRRACVAGRTVSAAETEQNRTRCFRRAYEVLIDRSLIEPGEMVGLPGANVNGSLDALTGAGQPDKGGQRPDKPTSVRPRQDEDGGRTGQVPYNLSVVRPQPLENVSHKPAGGAVTKGRPAAPDRPDPLALYAAQLRQQHKPVPAAVDAAVRDAAARAGVPVPEAAPGN